MKFLSKVKLSNRRYKTPEGYLVCVDSIIARTGKQEYLKSEIFQDSNDDSIIQIDRPKSEVLSPSTIASFENKPLVDEHPDEDVNVDNYRDYAIGFARDVRASKLDDTDILIANLIFTDPEAIAEIESGEKTELSCGYDCDILGEGDNLYQANIRGNHIALCKAGRAGIARIQDSSSKETKEVVDSGYSEKLKDLSPEERSKKIDELIADEIEAIDGYKEAMKYADEADKSIYSTIIAEELKHIIELKALKNENFKELKDSNIKDIEKKEFTYNGFDVYLVGRTSDDAHYEIRYKGKGVASCDYSEDPKKEIDKLNLNVVTIYGITTERKWDISHGRAKPERTFTSLSEAQYEQKKLEREDGIPYVIFVEKEITYINNKKFFEDEENKKMRDGALRGIHLKKIRNTLRNEDEDLVEDFLDYMDTRPDLVKEYDDYSDYMVREDFETWKKYKKIKTRDVDTYEEVTEDLEKELRDSDTLKNLAYKFAQMGNYFDRAHSLNSKKILGKEDDEKIAEFYNLGLQVYKQLEQEVDYLKNNKRTNSNRDYGFLSETVSLLEDGSNTLYWTEDKKCKLVSKKINDLLYEYKKHTYKDSKVKDKLENKPINILIKFDSSKEANDALKSLQRKEKFMNSKLVANDTIKVMTTDIDYEELKNILKLYFIKNIKTIDSKVNNSEKLLNIIKLYKKVTKDSMTEAQKLLEKNNIKVNKITGQDKNFYLWLEDKTKGNEAVNILSKEYDDVKKYIDSTTKAVKIRVGAGLNNVSFNKKEVERAINTLGYIVKKWYAYGSDNVAVIDDKYINMDGYPYFNQQVKKLKRFGFAKDIYVDDNEIVFEGAKFNIKDSKLKDVNYEKIVEKVLDENEIYLDDVDYVEDTNRGVEILCTSYYAQLKVRRILEKAFGRVKSANYRTIILAHEDIK